MPKKLSLEQSKAFLQNLASALMPGYEFALWIEATANKNKFIAMLRHKAPNPILQKESLFLYIVASGFYREYIPIPINGLDSFLKKSNPALMFRPNQYMTLDEIAENIHCDLETLYYTVIKAIKNKIHKVLTSYDNDRHVFTIQATKRNNHTGEASTEVLKTMEELYVWADLHAN